jgi:alpha-galactosidase
MQNAHCNPLCPPIPPNLHRCVVSSPLTISFDLSNLTEYDTWWPVVANPRAIAINQAWAGSPGFLAAQSNGSYTTLVYHGSACEVSSNRSMPFWTVWAKPLSGGSVAVVALNSWSADVALEVPLTALGFPSGLTVSSEDVWTGSDTGNIEGTWNIPALAAHESKFLVLTPLPEES